MDIKKYVGWFHDGSLKEIYYPKPDHIVIVMTSAQVEDDEKAFDKRIKLSNDRMIMGKLHLEGIESIMINDSPFHGALIKDHDIGEVLDFELKDKHTVCLGISWINLPFKIEEIEYNFIVFKAKKIWWENMPDLAF